MDIPPGAAATAEPRAGDAPRSSASSSRAPESSAPQSCPPPSGTQWTIAAHGHRAVLVEVGGGLRHYEAGGAEIVDGYGADELCPGSAGKVLAPWPNRIRDGNYRFGGIPRQLPLTEPTRHNAIHGLASWLRWECQESGADTVTLAVELPAQPGYPWPLRLRTRWSVGPRGLRADHEAVNLGTEPCPFGLAAHPYLRLPGVAVDDLLLCVPARTRLLLDSRLLPIGAAKVAGSGFDFTRPRRIGGTALDTAFGDLIREPDGRSAVVLTAPDGPAAVAVWADRAFGWWQVFTADSLPAPRHRRSVAVEPMTCPPDAFRSGRDVVTLAPGETWRGSWGIEPRPGEE